MIATLDHDLNATQQFYRSNAATTTHDGRPSYNGATGLTYTHADQRTSRCSFRETRDESPFASSKTPASPTAKSSTAADRVKAATAVALSPDGKWLAVGESGYRPRVLIFSRVPGSTTTLPRTIIAEHTFGLQALAFSPDSSLLVTLGTVNDGFLRIWTIDSHTGALSLLASNKCTNLVKHICWMGRSLICVGVRFIKVWRPDDSLATGSTDSPSTNAGHATPLLGRNTLLGDLLEATFTAAVAISSVAAMLCTDTGAVCVLDDTDSQQRLIKVKQVAFPITAAALGPRGKVIVAGEDDRIELCDIPAELPRSVSPISRSRPASPVKTTSIPVSTVKNAVVAVGSLAGSIICLDHQHTIRLLPFAGDTFESSLAMPLLTLPSQPSPVLGVRPLIRKDVPGFLTWSPSGEVTGWTHHGQPMFEWHVPLYDTEDGEAGELKTVICMSSVVLMVTGDKYGILSVVDTESGKCIHTTRAHAAQVMDIAVYEELDAIYIASCSRDRTVQVFLWQDGKLHLQDTLCEHVGSVTGVSFTSSGALISCSADRTIIVRQKMTKRFEAIKTITFKAAPVSIHLADNNTLIVSTLDRMIHFADIELGRVTYCFKTSDSDGGEAVAVSSLVLLSIGDETFLAAVSSTDKSIRVYNEDGALLALDWGHSEGITDIACVDNKLITVATDGTTFIWAFEFVSTKRTTLDPEAAASPLSRPPLRKPKSTSVMRKTQGLSVMPEESPRRSPRLAKRPSKLDINTATPRRPVLKPRRSTTELTSKRRSPSPLPDPSQGLSNDSRSTESPKRSLRHSTRSKRPPVPVRAHTALPDLMSGLSLTSDRSLAYKETVGMGAIDQDVFVDVPLSDLEGPDTPEASLAAHDTGSAIREQRHVPCPGRSTSGGKTSDQEGQALLSSLREFRLSLKDQVPLVPSKQDRDTRQVNGHPTDKENVTGDPGTGGHADKTEPSGGQNDRILLRYIEMELERTLEAVRTGLSVR